LSVLLIRVWLPVALASCLFGAPKAQAQSLASTGGLSFGAFVAGTGGAVAVTTSGGRSKTGGVMLVPQGVASAAAQFTVSGVPTFTYAITLPANNTVVLSDGKSHSMAVNGFISYPGATGTLSISSTQSLSVGATLAVGNAQPPGSYSGEFPVTINYN